MRLTGAYRPLYAAAFGLRASRAARRRDAGGDGDGDHGGGYDDGG
jgi:hypothetical protein